MRKNEEEPNEENKVPNHLNISEDTLYMVVNTKNTPRKIYDDISNQWIRSNVLDSTGALQRGIKKQLTNIFNEMIKETSAHFHQNFNQVRYISAHDSAIRGSVV